MTALPHLLFASFCRSPSTALSVHEMTFLVILGTTHIATTSSFRFWATYGGVHSILTTRHTLNFQHLKRKDDDTCIIPFIHHSTHLIPYTYKVQNTPLICEGMAAPSKNVYICVAGIPGYSSWALTYLEVQILAS